MNAADFIPGLLPPRPGDRQLLQAPMGGAPYVLPAYWDLRPGVLTASNQGQTPQCAAFAIAGLVEYRNWIKSGVTEQVDPEPIYRRSGEILGQQSGGRTLESVMQAARDLGLITPEEYGRVRKLSSPNEARQAIHRYGVVLSAFNITEAWFNAGSDGWISFSDRTVGGHAVLHVGFNHVEDRPWDSIQGSWSADQASQGFSRLSPELFDREWIGGLVIV